VSTRPFLSVLIGIALIAISAFISVLSYLQLKGNPDRDAMPQIASAEPAAPRLVSVLTARQPIKRGERVTRELLSEIRMEPPPPAGALSANSPAIDAVALTDIAKGQIVLEGSLLFGEGARPGLAILVPEGLRAVALRVNDEVSVGNFVRPNDRVDIHLVLPNDRVARARGADIRRGDHTESRLLLQNVLILSTGETLASLDGQNAIRMTNITVAVSPEDALMLAIAKNAGEFYLALRNSADEAVVEPSWVHLEDLLDPFPTLEEAALPAADSGPVAPRMEPPSRTVKIFRGVNPTVTVLDPDHSS
jgi:pilus assembly protein CpaB